MNKPDIIALLVVILVIESILLLSVLLALLAPVSIPVEPMDIFEATQRCVPDSLFYN